MAGLNRILVISTLDSKGCQTCTVMPKAARTGRNQALAPVHGALVKHADICLCTGGCDGGGGGGGGGGC